MTEDPPGEHTDSVLVSHQGPVTVVAINRPHRRNAVDGSTARRLLQAFEAFEGDEAAGVAVLTGTGGTFCAGADLKAFSEGEPRPVREEGRGPMGPTRLVTSKPVLAAVEGFAVAGGLELAIWCDLRVVASNAIFGVFCRRFGIPLVDGGTVRLPRLIGESQALDMVLTGREVGAAEALRMGLANRVVGPGQALEAAVRLAEELSALPQVCLRNDRLSLLGQWGLSEHDALKAETRFGLDSLSSAQAIEGAARFASGAGRGGATVDRPPGDPPLGARP
ncbi:MAG: crotonase/enoyl-CoA hydratase family protein [Acidimicrobiales bacterium]